MAFYLVSRTGFEPVTSPVPGLLSDLAHVRQARSRCPQCCPGVTVTALGRPSHRARGGHGLLIRGSPHKMITWKLLRKRHLSTATKASSALAWLYEVRSMIGPAQSRPSWWYLLVSWASMDRACCRKNEEN